MQKPPVQLGSITEHREDDRDDRHQHGDDSLRIAGHPERQIPVQERRTVFVEIAGAVSEGIFRVGQRGKLTGLLKDARPAMDFHNGLCQEIDQCGMDVFAHQDDVRGCNKDHVRGRNDPLEIDHSPR